MGRILRAVAKLDEHEVHAGDLIHHLVECLDCSHWIHLDQSLRDLDLSGDRCERLAQLVDDRVAEIDLSVGCAFHQRLPASGRLRTTMRVSGNSPLTMRAIAAPAKEGRSSSISATSGRNIRRSCSARSQSSDSPTTSRRGSPAKLKRNARRKTPSASPMTTRMWDRELWERDVGRTRPLHSRAGLGGWGRLSLVCIAHRLFLRGAEGTRSLLGHIAGTQALNVPERDPCSWFGWMDIRRYDKDPRSRSREPPLRPRKPALPD